MKEFLLSIIREMVDNPDRLKVEEIRQNENTILRKVDSDKSDIGKLIGKHGNNANAIRTVCIAVAAKKRMKLMVEFPR